LSIKKSDFIYQPITIFFATEYYFRSLVTDEFACVSVRVGHSDYNGAIAQLRI
jgi:hypothetical protein